MALWPNNRRDIIGAFPTFMPNHTAVLEGRQLVQRNIAYFGNQQIAQSSSVPEGAFQGRACLIAPLVGGGMASANNAIDFTVSTDASLLSGGPMIGDATATMTGTGAMSLVIGMTGEAILTALGTGSLALTIGLSGNATGTGTASASLAMLVPMSGEAMGQLSGYADLKGLCSLSGDITPYTELSPENLANAVWASILDAGYTAKEIMQILGAFSAGKTDIVDLGGGSATVTFRDLGDTKDRIVGDMTNSERTTVTLDTDP